MFYYLGCFKPILTCLVGLFGLKCVIACLCLVFSGFADLIELHCVFALCGGIYVAVKVYLLLFS